MNSILSLVVWLKEDKQTAFCWGDVKKRKSKQTRLSSAENRVACLTLIRSTTEQHKKGPEHGETLRAFF